MVTVATRGNQCPIPVVKATSRTKTAEVECANCNPSGDFIVAVNSATMDVDNDKLGKALMKGYILPCLSVGSVSNMRTIVESVAQAGKVIRS